MKEFLTLTEVTVASVDTTTPIRVGTPGGSLPFPRSEAAESSDDHPAIQIQPQTPVRVPVVDLHVGESPRRGGLNDEHVTALASAGTWPPILVHRPTMIVVDGAHRLAAAKQLGRKDMEVAYFDGSVDDIFLEAVTRNVVRGLALTPADRRAAVLRILAEHPSLSTREIARRVGVRPATVADVRSGMEALPTVRLGRDGRRYRTDRAARRALAEDYFANHPDATLTEIADAAGIAVSTTKNIRDRVRAAGTGGPTARPSASAPSRGTTPPPREALSLLGTLANDPSVRGHESTRSLLLHLRQVLAVPTLVAETSTDIPTHQRRNTARLVSLCGMLLTDAAQHLATGSDC